METDHHPDAPPPPPALARAAQALQRALAMALLAAVLLNVANVVARYGFGRSITGADELQVYLMVALAFLGSVVALVRAEHLRMDVLARRFPAPLRRLVDAGEALATLLLCGGVCAVSTRYAWRMHGLGSVSQDAGLPLWLPHAVVALAFAAMAGVALVALAGRLAPLARAKALALARQEA
ncbi:TRAP transporter small permease [Pseudorhodoferax sp.]|uniref:TRAP transporter small permease n=1 Tax=Pseudorhodoferax sp. TaxID=1993553 RepID=UPI002DD61AB6|nr:TRAP transporter small permease [Pseudorhodoferax sp.]